MAEIQYSEIIKVAKEINKEIGIKKNYTLLVILLTVLLIVLTEFVYLFPRINYLFHLHSIGLFALIYDNLSSFALDRSIADRLIIIISLITFILSAIFLALICDFIKVNWKRRSYTWNPKHNLKDWELHGSIILAKDNDEDMIDVKSSELGLIIKNRSWKNYVMRFEFKIPKIISYGDAAKENQLERGFGIIYRAKDLDEYYMLKIDKNGYQPHIRNRVYWENFGPTVTPYKFNDVNNLDTWVPVELKMNKNVLSVQVGEHKFYIHLPTHSLVKREFSSEYKGTIQEAMPIAKLSYREDGTVGFRSAPLEEVYIRKLTIVSNNFPFSLYYNIERRMKKIRGTVGV